MLDCVHLALYLLLAQFQVSRIACSALWSVASVTSREIDCFYLNVIVQISVDELIYRSELDPNFRPEVVYLCRVSNLEFIEQWWVYLWWGTLSLSRPVLLSVRLWKTFSLTGNFVIVTVATLCQGLVGVWSCYMFFVISRLFPVLVPQSSMNYGQLPGFPRTWSLLHSL